MNQQTMHIGFGTTLLAQRRNRFIDGIATYTQALHDALCKEGINITPYIFNKTKEAHDCAYQSLGNLFEWNLAKGLLWGQCFPKPNPTINLFHATDHHIPKFNHIPVVATIMDPIPLIYPKWTNPKFRQLKNWAFKHSARWADHIITISEFSAQEIARHFDIPRDKISVTPLGVDSVYFDAPEKAAQQTFLHKLQLDRPFFLHIGTLQPRKNIERLLDAYEALPSSIQKEYPLVIAGQVGWQVNALLLRLNQLHAEGKVHYLGYVSDAEKRILLHTAHALVFPSLYEGFGLPILEAFAANLPVITSNTTAIPEVAGDAAILINPWDTQAIKQAMQIMIEAPDLRRSMQEKGQLIAKQHTWQTCAQNTLAVYKYVLGQKYS